MQTIRTKTVLTAGNKVESVNREVDSLYDVLSGNMPESNTLSLEGVKYNILKYTKQYSMLTIMKDNTGVTVFGIGGRFLIGFYDLLDYGKAGLALHKVWKELEQNIEKLAVK